VFPATLFICPLLLRALHHQIQTLGRNFNISPVSLPAVLLEAMQYVDNVSPFGQVNGSIPSPLIRLFQLVHARTNGIHTASLAAWLSAQLKLAERKPQAVFHRGRKCRQHLQRIPLEMNLCRPRGFVFERDRHNIISPS